MQHLLKGKFLNIMIEHRVSFIEIIALLNSLKSIEPGGVLEYDDNTMSFSFSFLFSLLDDLCEASILEKKLFSWCLSCEVKNHEIKRPISDLGKLHVCENCGRETKLDAVFCIKNIFWR